MAAGLYKKFPQFALKLKHFWCLQYPRRGVVLDYNEDLLHSYFFFKKKKKVVVFFLVFWLISFNGITQS